MLFEDQNGLLWLIDSPSFRHCMTFDPPATAFFTGSDWRLQLYEGVIFHSIDEISNCLNRIINDLALAA